MKLDHNEYLNKWTYPDSYFGATWYEYYVFLGRNRDSDLLTESNFESALESLGGESETVQVVCENHWAVGWIEWIAIHETDLKALQTASEIMTSLADYPVLDEEDHLRRESEERIDRWNWLNIEERIELISELNGNIFASRHDYPPIEVDNHWAMGY